MQPPRKARVHLVALCLGCQVLGCQTPSIWIDPEADFSRYRTWTMRAVPAEARDDEAGAVDPVLYLLVAAALARELDARGYSTSALAAPDLLVSYCVHLTLERETRVVAIPKTVVAPSGQGYTATHTREVVVEYEKGRIEIEVQDALRREIVWRGEATARVRSSFAHEIDSIVEKIMRSFPTARRSV